MDEKRSDKEPNEPDASLPADVDDHVDHDDLTTELVAYLDGELDRQANELIGTKISLNPVVRAEADALKKTWDLLDHLPRPEPSPNFTERTISKIEPLRQSGGVGSPSAASSKTARTPFSLPASPILTPRRSPSGRLAVMATWLIAVGAAGAAGYFIRSQVVAGLNRMDQSEKDARILTERRLLLNLRNFQHVDDLKFLEALDNPDLFGDEHAAPASEVAR